MSPVDILTSLFGLLHAAYWNHWTAHWQAKGTPAYGDHLLYERLYQGMVEEIDGLAEKMVAGYGVQILDAGPHLVITSAWTARWSAEPDIHKRAYRVEQDIQKALRNAYNVLKEQGALSLGMDDFLMAMASDHETHLYLLGQRIAPQKVAAILRHVFVVRDPTEDSTLDDIIHRTDAAHLASYIVGTGVKLWREENSTLHDSETSAKQDALVRLQKLQGARVAGVPSRGQKFLDGGAQPDLSAAAHFFDKPSARETREFAQSKAISNDPQVTSGALREDELAQSARQVRKELAQSPPTVGEVLELPGANEFSTLNRYVVQTAQPTDSRVPQSRVELLAQPKHAALEMAERIMRLPPSKRRV